MLHQKVESQLKVVNLNSMTKLQGVGMERRINLSKLNPINRKNYQYKDSEDLESYQKGIPILTQYSKEEGSKRNATSSCKTSQPVQFNTTFTNSIYK
jgi:hypothetical protein